MLLLAATALASSELERHLDQLKNAAWPEKAEAARALGRIGDRRAVEALMSALDQTQHPGVRSAAAEALGELRELRAIPILVEMLNASAPLPSLAPEVRRAAAEALSKLGWRPSSVKEAARYATARDDTKGVSTEVLAEVVKADGDKRWAALQELARSGGSSAIVRFVDPGAYSDASVRSAAVMTLGKIGDARAADSLIQVLKTDPESSVQANAASVLGDLRALGAVEPLLVGLRHKDRNLRISAANALGAIGDRRAVRPLVAALPDWWVGPHAAKALETLGWSATSPEEVIHFLVAGRDGAGLRTRLRETTDVLLNELRTGVPARIENAIYAFVGLGRDDVIGEVVVTLERQGSKQMAEAFLNSGDHRLTDAARRWAHARGYQVHTGTGSAPVRWGGM
jgi:HEAT repeat protein